MTPARQKQPVSQHPPDLRALFGSRFRVEYEAEGVTRRAWGEEEAWLLELRCKHGGIYPYGGDLLAAYTDRPRVGRRLRRLPCAVTARGDEEVVITFRVNDVGAVLKVLRPFSRRQLSPARRAQSAATLARARQKRREALLQRAFPARESTQRDQHDPPPHPDALRAFETPEVVLSHEQGGERR